MINLRGDRKPMSTLTRSAFPPAGEVLFNSQQLLGSIGPWLPSALGQKVQRQFHIGTESTETIQINPP